MPKSEIQLAEWIEKYKPIVNEKNYTTLLKGTVLEHFVWDFLDYGMLVEYMVHRRTWSVKKEGDIITIEPGSLHGSLWKGYIITDCPYTNQVREFVKFDLKELKELKEIKENVDN